MCSIDIALRGSRLDIRIIRLSSTADTGCNRHHLGDGSHAELFHHAMAVHLDLRSEIPSAKAICLFEIAADDQLEYFGFPRAQGRYQRPVLLTPLALAPLLVILGQHSLDSPNQHREMLFSRKSFAPAFIASMDLPIGCFQQTTAQRFPRNCRCRKPFVVEMKNKNPRNPIRDRRCRDCYDRI